MTNFEIKWYKEIDSTNLEVSRKESEHNDFTIFAAEFQTAGRGQRGNKWESAIGRNLTFSILLKPANLHPVNQFRISEVVALGVVSYLQSKGLSPKIKWPNDIYVDDLKICGILIEHSIINDRLSVSIAGIGVNVNQTSFQSDAPNPTSLILELRKRIDPSAELLSLTDELPVLAAHINGYYSRMNIDYKAIEEEYLSKLYRKNIVSKFIDMRTDKEFMGSIQGIDKNACLIIKDTDNQDRHFTFKELKYII